MRHLVAALLVITLLGCEQIAAPSPEIMLKVVDDQEKQAA